MVSVPVLPVVRSAVVSNLPCTCIPVIVRVWLVNLDHGYAALDLVGVHRGDYTER